jgi:toxin ParE1/3/4
VSRYSISPKAREDLKAIYRYVMRDRPLAAKTLRQAFYDGFRLLASQPLIGQSCFNLRADLRAFSVGNYVIFYVPATHGVQIQRVLHGARDIQSLF